MSLKLLTISLAGLIFFLILELVREQKLTFKYAFGWLGVSVLAIFLTVFDTILFQFASFLGFQLASNFIFFALLSVFVFLCLLMTVFLCQQDRRNQIMAQKIGALEFEINQIKKENSQQSTKNVGNDSP